MKVVILAGGLGTRLAEETGVKPKPMVEIGGKPILWHIMSIYAHYGYNEFAAALGYKGEMIKDYFLKYHYLNNNFCIRLEDGKIDLQSHNHEDWIVQLVDTGLQTQTGGRVKRMSRWIGDQTFMLTYGDGVADINIQELVQFHRRHGKLATITAVRPPARYGALKFSGDLVTQFKEKPQSGEGWINGGFLVLEPKVLDYIEGDLIELEKEPLERLAAEEQLVAYRHEGFWQCMDTMRDVRLLESLWKEEKAPWKVWK